MSFPPGAQVLAIQEPDVAYLLDGDLHLLVGVRAAVVLPLRQSTEANLDTLERLRALIDAAGDALAGGALRR